MTNKINTIPVPEDQIAPARQTVAGLKELSQKPKRTQDIINGNVRPKGSRAKKLLAAGAIGLLAAGAGNLGGSDEVSPKDKETVTHIVQAGENPSSIANEYNPGEDIRDDASYIQKQDGDGIIHPGQRIEVPVNEEFLKQQQVAEESTKQHLADS